MKSKCLLYLILLLVLALAACGRPQEPAPGEDSGASTAGPVAQATKAPLPSPTLAPTPTVQPTVVPTTPAGKEFDSGAIVKPVDLNSFRSEIGMTWTGIISDGTDVQGSLEMIIEYVREPPAQRISLSGDYPGLEEMQAQSGGTDASLDIYVVDGKTYMNLFGTWIQTEAQPDQFDVEDMAFGASDELVQDLKGVKYEGRESVNGIEVNHYSFDENAFQNGDFGGGEIENATGNIYLAVDGNYMVRMDVTMTGTNFEMPTGGDEGPFEEGTFEMSLDLSSINEPIDITVPEEAVQSSDTPEDVPLPADASEVTVLEDFIQFSSATSPEELATWYKDEMPANGWTLTDESGSDDMVMLQFTKDTRTASFILTTDSSSGETSVMITLLDQ
jgi:hypothetical protein